MIKLNPNTYMYTVHCMRILPMQNTARSSVFHSYEEVWKVDYGPLHVCKFSLPPPPPSSSISLTPPPPSPPAPTILNNKFNS